MRGSNFNISNLFSSLGNNNSFGGFNFGDYTSIKNGSYRKLLKSYYAEQKKNPANNDKTTGKKDITKKEILADTTGLSSMKKGADELKTSAEAFGKDDLWKQKDGELDMDKIAGAVKNFVKEYNDVLEQSEKVTSKEVTQSVNYMNSMTGTMSKLLSKVGITVGADGKMSVDEDELKKSDAKNLKSLFQGKSSYASQIVDKANEISKDAVMGSSVYQSNGTLSSSFGNIFNKWI